MHRIPALLAAVPRDRSEGILVARRRLDGGLILEHRPQSDSADLPLSALVFTHDHSTGFHRRTWQRRPTEPEVDLVVTGNDQAIAHGIVYGRTIFTSGHPAASTALILATGIVRLSNALALPLLLDFALADILAWLRSPQDVDDDAPCWDEVTTFYATRQHAPSTAIALAFERARQLQEVAR